MKLGKTIGILLAGVVMLSSCGGETGNKNVVMTIGDTEVTEGAIQFVAKYGLGSNNASAAADFIKESLMVNEVAKKSGKTLTDEENEKIKLSLASFKSELGGKKKADEYMQQYNTDDSLILELMSSSLYSSSLEDLTKTEESSDEECKEYFKNNFMRAKHVLISTVDQSTGDDLPDDKAAEAEVTANEVLVKAQSGEDFDALIQQYNTDPGMNSNPDGYFFPEGKMVKEFEDTTKSLKPGEIAMCKTDYGFHIIKRLDINETPEIFEEYFEKNKAAVSEAMKAKKKDELIQNKANELGIKVDVNEDAIKNIKIEEDKEENKEENK